MQLFLGLPYLFFKFYFVEVVESLGPQVVQRK